jgi:hypothetical protein
MKNTRDNSVIIVAILVMLIAGTLALSSNHAFAKSRVIQSSNPTITCPNTNTITNNGNQAGVLDEQQNTSHCASTSVQQAGHDQAAAPSTQQRTSND